MSSTQRKETKLVSSKPPIIRVDTTIPGYDREIAPGMPESFTVFDPVNHETSGRCGIRVVMTREKFLSLSGKIKEMEALFSPLSKFSVTTGASYGKCRSEKGLVEYGLFYVGYLKESDESVKNFTEKLKSFAESVRASIN